LHANVQERMTRERQKKVGLDTLDENEHKDWIDADDEEKESSNGPIVSKDDTVYVDEDGCVWWPVTAISKDMKNNSSVGIDSKVDADSNEDKTDSSLSSFSSSFASSTSALTPSPPSYIC